MPIPSSTPRNNYRQTNKSVSFSLDFEEENNNFDDFSLDNNKQHSPTAAPSPKLTFDDDENDSIMRDDEQQLDEYVARVDSPRFDSDDDPMYDDDHRNHHHEDLSQPLSQISSSEILDDSSAIKVKTEIDELFEECEREKQEEVTYKSRSSSDVKSPILTFSASVPTQVSSPILSSPVGLSQYQKEQRNVYQYEDINQLTQQSAAPKTENDQEVIDLELTESQLESLQREDEGSTFHNFEKTEVTAVKEENIAVQNSSIASMNPTNNVSPPKQQEEQQPNASTSSDPNISTSSITTNNHMIESISSSNNNNNTVPTTTEDDDELDIDYSQIEAALREADEQEKLNAAQECTKDSYVSPMEQFRSKIVAPQSSPQPPPSSPRTQSSNQTFPKVKDEIQMSQERSLLPPPVIMDEIENSEGSQMDSVKLSVPTKSPERPLTFREAVYKKLSHSPPSFKPIIPDKELVAIKDQYGLIVFQRGNNYANEERIFEMNVDTIEVEDGVELTFLTSKCWGTLEVPYSQSIVFDSKTMNLKKCKCSCPVEDHCKHTCASLITWLDCKKKNLPFPSLNSIGSRLELALNELTQLRKEVERLRKENECLKDNYSSNSDDSSSSSSIMKDSSVTTPIKMNHQNLGQNGFVSSNSIEKTPPNRAIFSSPISPSNVAESTDLKRKRTTYTQGERDPHVELGETCKKIHF
ncbi:hypothetical protein FDP41_008998 [Naegleria fowleri]|uniref:SWIM-type domain-containing protein n=1 Tax=Naegleria fowleri TaxID=5763 RepID=A0A6A5BI94_NAEFO|nr:uncharacterized protein FDP41_008998 [Naegleria fowleri]KAF0972749.1 hypothetical protein FDP41_008998 [Naegleria fowleri]CAG4713954.1 unnamed protein product [Naegleria fowleri]